MRNKRLLATIIALIMLLILGIYQENSGNSPFKQSNLKKIGVLQFITHPALDEIYRGIKHGLKEEGLRNSDYEIIFKNAQGDQSKLMMLANEIIETDPKVVIGIATPAAQALANQTKQIPIVLGAITDPVKAKLVQNMQNPGGNITGVSDQPPIAAQFALAKELLPKARKVGILSSSAEDNSKAQVEQATTIAKKNQFNVTAKAVSSINEVNAAVEVLASEVDFIYIPVDNVMASAMQTIVSKAQESKIPIIPASYTMVKDGGLATVGLNQFALGEQTGRMAAQIFKGKIKPATTPIFTFKTGEKVVNIAQAKKLGIVISEAILNDKKIQKVGK